MARNAIESDFRTIQNGRRWLFCQKYKKLCIDLKCPEINAIEREFRTPKMADRSQMARNAIESDFRTSKMGDGGHFVKI